MWLSLQHNHTNHLNHVVTVISASYDEVINSHTVEAADNQNEPHQAPRSVMIRQTLSQVHSYIRPQTVNERPQQFGKSNSKPTPSWAKSTTFVIVTACDWAAWREMDIGVVLSIPTYATAIHSPRQSAWHEERHRRLKLKHKNTFRNPSQTTKATAEKYGMLITICCSPCGWLLCIDRCKVQWFRVCLGCDKMCHRNSK